MRAKLFEFDLPPDRIALRPAEPRDAARLLVVQPGRPPAHHYFRELPRFLNSGDILSFNDSRVIPARLSGIRPPRAEGGQAVPVEVTLHRRVGEARYRAFVKPARRLRPGDRILFGPHLSALVLGRQGGEIEFGFDQAGADLDRAIALVGSMPLPPYIAKKRAPDAQDLIDYQTVYARHDGSVAAPTAGLHFTPDLLARLAQQGIGRADLTLHVGAGTFLPVEVEDTKDHVMHTETATLDAAMAARLNNVHAAGGRIAAVGTTALRTLESAAAPDGRLAAFAGDTAIFITPGYRFRAVDMLITNFHLPRSTLFMLVCAFMGTETMQAAYAEAIAHHYRFYSYGDACLLIRPR